MASCIFVFVLFVILGVESYEHRCIHDQIVDKVHTRGEIRTPLNHKNKRVPTVWESIRLDVNTDYLQEGADPYACYTGSSTVLLSNGTTVSCSTEQMLTTDKRNFITEQLLGPLKAFWQSTLNVRRHQGNLNFGNTSFSCYIGATPLNIPNKYLAWSGGVPNTDLVILVSARPIVQTNVLAFASECLADSYGRSVLGFLNFDPSAIDASSVLYQSQLGTALHESTHVLGFSWTKVNGTQTAYTSFWNDSSASNQLKSQVFKQYDAGEGRIVTELTTPTLVEVARNHFQCSTMTGVELENQGDMGSTALSHWEKRLLNTEYMIGTTSRYPVVSNFTLSYLQDSGWYSVNFSNAKPFYWGAGKGCNFVPNCKLWPTEGYFCTSTNTKACNFDRTAISYCPLTSISGLPPYYYYFSDTTVGSDTLADYCPYWYAYSNGYCIEGSGSSGGYLEDGQYYGPTSRCFDTSLAKNSASATDVKQGCYVTNCTGPGKLKVKIESVWWDCPSGSTLKPDNYGGQLNCPSSDVICYNAPVDPNWPEFISVTPSSGNPGTAILITGTGFTPGMKIQVYGKDADNIVWINTTLYSCSVGGASKYSQISSFTAGKVHIIMTDSEGRTAVGYNAFDLSIPFNEDVLAAMGQWLVDRPGALAGIIIGVILLYAFCGILLYIERRRTKRAQKESTEMQE